MYLFVAKSNVFYDANQLISQVPVPQELHPTEEQVLAKVRNNDEMQMIQHQSFRRRKKWAYLKCDGPQTMAKLSDFERESKAAEAIHPVHDMLIEVAWIKSIN